MATDGVEELDGPLSELEAAVDDSAPVAAKVDDVRIVEPLSGWEGVVRRGRARGKVCHEDAQSAGQGGQGGHALFETRMR